ncbi:MAG: folate-binding protein YgfZ [Stappia sp.]|uniref:CAF17-like 4Fe-4S cluster assembly/insertion protein YgfZ n=1 Tax=Stappia sp. TaxID=1870903 RepID=UPI000C47DA6B|nr:folate-binding protein YgfZ [Stappia sp.]MAA97955.1 folate-binding protein YgfZ [Stappia sp.]MBM19631.1 folate-binding protein YgfZ [Stappia sp.]
MTSGTAVRLGGRALARVSGEDARHFLQNLITCDLDHVGDTGASHGALLTPQGKILFAFLVRPTGDGGYLLETDAASLPDLVKRLTFYKLRAKVTVEDVSSSFAVFAAWDADAGALRTAFPDAHVFDDPRRAELGLRLYLPLGDAGDDASAPAGLAGGTEADWHARRVASCVPEAPFDYALGDAFPHDVDMDELGGVAFDKGCFVGQEVVSRMQHRGTARRRVIQVSGADALPASGTDVMAGDKPAGQLGTVAGARGLALVRLDRIAQARAAGTPVTAGDVALEPHIPDWASFDWPVPAGGD